MAKHSKRKSKKWFIAVRGSYLPNSREGWLTYIPYTAYLVLVAYIGWHFIDSRIISILFVLAFWIAATILMTDIAKHKS